jgi:hypothetical protein
MTFRHIPDYLLPAEPLFDWQKAAMDRELMEAKERVRLICEKHEAAKAMQDANQGGLNKIESVD